MSSKYDNYWLSKMDEIKDKIYEAINKKIETEIDVEDLKSFGRRNSWYGVVEVSNDGIKAGEMVHAGSLGRMLLKQDFFKKLQEINIKCIVTSDLTLRIKVVGSIVEAKDKRKIKEKITTIKLEKIDFSQSLVGNLYFLLGKLPIFDYNFKTSDLPENGIYFFYEKNESCVIGNNTTDRIVRVGINKNDYRFKDRIRNHYRGNKNCSVFRKHVGSAIINLKDINSLVIG